MPSTPSPDPADVAVLHVTAPAGSRATRRFLATLERFPGAPRVVVHDQRAGAPPRLTLVVGGLRVWEHHGRRPRDLPDPAFVAGRAVGLRPFRAAAAS